MLASSLAWAAGGQDPKVEVRLFGGYRAGGSVDDVTYDYDTDKFDENLDVKPSTQLGFTVNIPFTHLGISDPNNNMMLEFCVNYQPTLFRSEYNPDIDYSEINPEFKVNGDKVELFDIGVTYIHAGFLYQWTNSKWLPYLNATLGVTSATPDVDEGSRQKFSMSLGGGLKHYMTDHFAFRFNLQVYGTFLGENGELYVDQFGRPWIHEDASVYTQGSLSTGLVYAF